MRPPSVGGEDDRRAKERSATTRGNKRHKVPTHIQDPQLPAPSDSARPWGPRNQGPMPNTRRRCGSGSESGRMAWVAIGERVGSTRPQEKTDAQKKDGKQGAGQLTQVNNRPPMRPTASWHAGINHGIAKHRTCGRGMHIIKG